jgi:hypothetical protein
MNGRFFRFLGWIILILFLNVPTVQGATPDRQQENPGTFSLYFENDLFFNTDQHYTNGVKLTWISPDLTGYAESKKLPDWSHRYIRMLPFINEAGLKRNVSFSIGQAMYTPADTEKVALVKEDRPYAGWTYVAIAFHSKNEQRLDSMEIQLGLVGPQSYAQSTQKAVHDFRGFASPQGWDNQLKNEPGLNFIYARRWRAFHAGLGNGLGGDVLTLLGGALGNIYTYANTGIEARFGWNVPVDFGESQIQPASSANAPLKAEYSRLSGLESYSLYFYASANGRAVLRDIFLDGNTLARSHSVDKEFFVGDLAFGMVMIFYRMKLSIAEVIRSREFQGQQGEQKFASITLSFTY